MRHAKRNQRLSHKTSQRKALLGGLVRSLVVHNQIRTTQARAKETQRLADRLVSLGKEGSIASRRRAFRILQDRGLVKRLFVEIAPRFTDVTSGFTRVVRLSIRRGDGSQRSVLAFTRIPEPIAITQPKTPPPPQALPPPQPQPERTQPKRVKEEHKKGKGLFSGFRKLWSHGRKGE